MYSIVLEALDFHKPHTIPQIHQRLIDQYHSDLSLFSLYKFLERHEKEGDVRWERLDIPLDSGRTTKPKGYYLTTVGIGSRLSNRRVEVGLERTLVPGEQTP